MENHQIYLNKSSRDAYGIAFYQNAELDERIDLIKSDSVRIAA